MFMLDSTTNATARKVNKNSISQHWSKCCAHWYNGHFAYHSDCTATVDGFKIRTQFQLNVFLIFLRKKDIHEKCTRANLKKSDSKFSDKTERERNKQQDLYAKVELTGFQKKNVSSNPMHVRPIKNQKLCWRTTW